MRLWQFCFPFADTSLEMRFQRWSPTRFWVCLPSRHWIWVTNNWNAWSAMYFMVWSNCTNWTWPITGYPSLLMALSMDWKICFTCEFMQRNIRTGKLAWNTSMQKHILDQKHSCHSSLSFNFQRHFWQCDCHCGSPCISWIASSERLVSTVLSFQTSDVDAVVLPTADWTKIFFAGLQMNSDFAA